MLKQYEDSKRDIVFDICKGIGVILVIYNHCSPYYFKNFVNSFHMALFFFVSGVLCGISTTFREGTVCVFLKSRLRSLILPYYVFGLLDLVVYCVVSPELFDAENTIARQTWYYLIGMRNASYYYFTGTLWFVPVLFGCQFFVFILQRIIKKDIWWLVTLCILIFVDGLIIKHVPILPFNIDLIPIALPFFIFSYFVSCKFDIKKLMGNEAFPQSERWFISLILLAVLIFLTKDATTSFFNKSFTNTGIFLIGGILGGTMVFMIAIDISRHYNLLSNLLAIFGAYSYEIMAIHQQWIIHLMNRKKLLDGTPMTSAFRFVITTCASLIFAVILRGFLKRVFPKFFSL